MSDDTPSHQPHRFFLHYPQGRRIYVCIVDQQRRAFDLTDNTFKPGKKLASTRDACIYAGEHLDERAAHGCSYSVEIDLSRLLTGTNPEMILADGGVVTLHWLEQVGEDPDVTLDKRLTNSCRLRQVNGWFEPANKWDADLLDEARTFEQRARQEMEYREFTLREFDIHDVTQRQLVTGVREGNVAAVLRVLAKDICEWAGSLKRHLLHQITHSAKDPFFVRSRMVPKNAPFQVFEHWVIRPLIGSHEAYNLLEFHKSAEFARSFSQRLEVLEKARVEFSQRVIEYTVQHRGEDVEGVFVLDEARKDLKHMALGLAEYLDIIAQQIQVAQSPIDLAVDRERGKPQSNELVRGEDASMRLWSVYTNGVVNQKLVDAARVLEDSSLSTGEKLMRIDKLVPLPPTASAAQLGKMLGVSKTMVLKTPWWIQNRKGEKDDEVGRRRSVHKERAGQLESHPGTDGTEQR
jgi:hypothetical protein